MVLDAQNLSIPLLTAVLDFITNEASALDAVASETPAASSFDPTKPLVLKTINLPGKTTLLESQLQALQDWRNAFESDVPERCVTVFRAENGVNPRNFGENTYANMTRASDDVESVEKEVVEKESVKKENIMEEENDAALLKQQIQCCIEKLMPRLRFESTYRELKKRGERGFVDRVEGDRNTRVLQVLLVSMTDV